MCDGPLLPARQARLSSGLAATVDLRPIGSIELRGSREADDFRWAAYVASDRRLGQAGAARVGADAWSQEPGGAWVRVGPADVEGESVDLQVLSTALRPGNRVAAEDRGVEVIEGARARRCRVAVDGVTFEAAFPQVRWLVGDADLHRWRGQLDYWVFLDGQLGQVVGDAWRRRGRPRPGRHHRRRSSARLTATERDRDVVIYPPAR